MLAFVTIALALALGIAAFGSPFASGAPDGLETVAAQEDFARAARESHVADGPLADYEADGVEGPASRGVAGFIGVLVSFGLASALFAGLRWQRRRSSFTDD